ncbi:hypothetical protein EG344_08495 [Chryseobacterium sp. G0162]|nr:hypothetical protein EG344_08495 [Chryseobacterium sp. G0162]
MKSNKIFSIITDFIKFIYKPNYDKSDDCVGRAISKLLLLFLVVFVLRVLFIFADEFFLLTHLKKSIAQPDLKILILSCSLVPIIEEIAFRLPLIFSPIHLSLSTCILSFYIINNFFSVENQYDIENYFFLRVLIAVIIGFIVWFVSKSYADALKTFYKRNPFLIIYTYSLVFAMMHIGNYIIDSNFLLTYVWVILPVFISALLYSFARLKYGFFYSLSLHVINNLIPTIIHFII